MLSRKLTGILIALIIIGTSCLDIDRDILRTKLAFEKHCVIDSNFECAEILESKGADFAFIRRNKIEFESRDGSTVLVVPYLYNTSIEIGEDLKDRLESNIAVIIEDTDEHVGILLPAIVFLEEETDPTNPLVSFYSK